MSALLPIDAYQINLNAEYGYSSRKFEKVPRVVVSTKNTSCLFLVLTQEERITPLSDKPRNFYALYANHNSVVVARVETTLIHRDNDAVIEYDFITPTDDVCGRFRATYENWDVSFDRINYKNTPPDSWLGYRLLSSGHWWFFDRGVVLNGLNTSTEYETKCLSTLIYYEFHVDHKITLPSSECMPTHIDVVHDPSDLAPPPADSPSKKTVVTLSNLPVSLLPQLNVDARSLVTQNFSTKVSEVQHTAAIPTKFWFVQRQEELERGNKDYFVAQDEICPLYNELYF